MSAKKKKTPDVILEKEVVKEISIGDRATTVLGNVALKGIVTNIYSDEGVEFLLLDLGKNCDSLWRTRNSLTKV